MTWSRRRHFREAIPIYNCSAKAMLGEKGGTHATHRHPCRPGGREHPEHITRNSLGNAIHGAHRGHTGRGTIAPFRSQTRSKDFTVAGRTTADVVMAQITLA